MSMLNVAGVVKHLDEIRISLSDKKLDVLAIDEARLDPTIPDGFVSIDGYDVLRNDRDRNWEGVCIYVRCNLNYENCSDLVPNGLEAVCVEIKPTNTQSFIVSSIYRPPCSPSEIFTLMTNAKNFIFWEI